jgi:hypothetical protein
MAVVLLPFSEIFNLGRLLWETAEPLSTWVRRVAWRDGPKCPAVS